MDAENLPYGDIFRGGKAKSYLAERIHKPIWGAEHRAVQRFLAYVPNNGSVLDVPFGTGRFCDLYRAKGMGVFGLDISQDMLDQARRELGSYYDACDLRCAEAYPLPFANESFDVVVSTRFLSAFVPFDLASKTLLEFRRVTKRHAIVSLNTRTADLPPVAQPLPHEKIGDRMHWRQLEAYVQEHGFEIVASEVVKITKDKTGEKRINLLRTVGSDPGV